MHRKWVRLWRKTIDNPIWKGDRTAWKIFEYFLLRADYKTGKWTIDYRTMSEFLNIPRSTLHKSIRKLKKHKMVDDMVNEHNTTFSILNWEEYQGEGERDGGQEVDKKWTESGHISIIRRKEELQEGQNPADGFVIGQEAMAEYAKRHPRVIVANARETWENWHRDPVRNLAKPTVSFDTWCTNSVKYKQDLRPLTIEEQAELAGIPVIKTVEDAKRYLENKK